MDALSTNRKLLVWLYLCSDRKFTSKWEILGRFILSVSVLFINVSCVPTSAAYVYKYLTIDLAESLYALFQVAACIGSTYVLIIAFYFRDRIAALFTTLSEIYEENANEESFHFLVEVNELSGWICRSYFKVMGIFSCMLVIMTVISVWVCQMVQGRFDTKYLLHPDKVIVPWDQQTPMGYYAEVFYVIMIIQAYMLANGSLLLLFLSICLHHRAFSKMFQHSLNELDRIDGHHCAKQFLIKLIRFRIRMKDWFFDSADIYSLMIMVHSIASMIFLTCIVFQFDLQLQHTDFTIIMVFYCATVASSNLYAFCFCGDMATESYANMADGLYECNWYELPADLQKYLILMISNAQRELCYHGFQMFVLNLETFTAILKTVITYYMMFKTITSK